MGHCNISTNSATYGFGSSGNSGGSTSARLNTAGPFIMTVSGGEARFTSLDSDANPLPSCLQSAIPLPARREAMPAVFTDPTDGMPVVCAGLYRDTQCIKLDASGWNGASGMAWKTIGNTIEAGHIRASDYRPEMGLVIVGGYGSMGGGRSKNIEMSKDNAATFQQLDPMPSPFKLSGLERSSVVILDENTFIIIGGHGSAPSERTVLSYDLRTNNYTALPDMPIDNYDHSAVLVGRDIWVVGGYRNGDKVHIFNLDTEQWREGPTFPVTIKRTDIVPYKDSFLVVGGSGAGNKMWKLNLDNQSWDELTARLPWSTSYHAATLLAAPDNC